MGPRAPECIHHQQHPTHYDRRIGHIKIRPVIVPSSPVQLYVEKIDHVTVMDTIKGVANGAS